MHRHASEVFVQGPGRGMERVSPASPDGDHLDVVFGHEGEGVLAQGCADVAAPVSRRHGEDDDIAVAPGRVDLPGDIAGDRVVTGLGDATCLPAAGSCSAGTWAR